MPDGSWKLSACLWYFFFFGSEVCVWPFLNVFMSSQASLSSDHIGIISACRLWSNLAGAPLFTSLSDRHDSHLTTTIILLLSCNGIRLLLPFCSSFSSLLAVVVASEVLNAPIYALADSVVAKHCTKEGEYASYRLYGSIGWGAFSVIAGAALDRFGLWSAFVINISLLLPVLWLTFRLFRPSQPSQPMCPPTTRDPSNHDDELLPLTLAGKDSQELDSKDSISISIKSVSLVHSSFVQKALLLITPQCLLFLFTISICGLGYGLIESFLFILLKDQGASDLLLGLTIAITCIAAVPIYTLQGKMIVFFKGPEALLDIALLTYVIRMLLYSLLPSCSSPWFVLPIELLHGLTFPCAWGGGTEIAKKISPPGLEATTQGAFQAVFLGLGPGIGSLAGGFVAARSGYGSLFLQGSVMVLGGWGTARGLRWLATKSV